MNHSKRTAKTDWPLVLLLWAIGLAAAMQFSKFAISLELISEQYAVSMSVAAWILSSVGFMGIVFGAAVGSVVGAFGPRKALIIAMLIGTLTSIAQAFLPSLELMIASRFFEGISHLLIVVAAPTAIISSSALQHKAITMGLWSTFFGIAFAMTGIVGPLILRVYGLSYLFACHGILFAVLLGLFTLGSQDKVRSSTLSVLVLARDAWSEQFQVYRSVEKAFPALVFFWHTLMFVALLTYLHTGGTDLSAQRWLAAGLPIISIVGSFAGGAIAQKVRKPLPQIGISFALFAVSASVVAVSLGTSVYWLSACVMMLFSGIIQASVFAAIPLLCTDEYDQAEANGAVTQLGNLGATCGPPLFTFFISIGGQIAAPMLAAGLAICSLAMILYLGPVRTKGVKNGHILKW